VVGSGEAGEDASQKITSLKRLLDKKKKNRTGYEDEKHVLYDETTFFDYLESEDPYEYLTKFNRLIIDEKSKDILKKHEQALKPPTDLELVVQDIKVLGRREFSHLLRLRHKYQLMNKRNNQAIEQKEKAAAREAAGPVDEEALIDAELERTIKRIEQQKKRQAKKDKERE